VGSLGVWQEEYGQEGSEVGGQGVEEQISGLGFLIADFEEKLGAGGQGSEIEFNSYVEQVDRAFDELNTSSTLLDEPAVAPVRSSTAPFGEMVARRGLKRVFAAPIFTT
jgi:hypothetical protein